METRRQRAWRDAKDAAVSWRELVGVLAPPIIAFGLIFRYGKGWSDALLVLYAAVAGAVLTPLIVYVVSFATARGRILTDEIVRLRAAVQPIVTAGERAQRESGSELSDLLLEGVRAKNAWIAEDAHREKERHREQIERWRAMLHRHVPKGGGTVVVPFPPSIIYDEDWLSLRPHLSAATLSLCEHAPREEGEKPPFTDHIAIVVGSGGPTTIPYYGAVLADIERLREEWGID